MNNAAIRCFVTGFLVALVAFTPHLVAAQSARPVQAAPSTTGASVDHTTARDRALIGQAVQNTHDSYKRSRTGDGVGGIISGVIIGGFGAYLYIAGDNIGDPTLQVIGIGVALTSIPRLIAGIWNIFYLTPQEEIAIKLLADERLLDGAGLVFVEQEARRAKRSRLVGGTTSIAEGLAIMGSYFLYSRVFGSVDILLAFFGVVAALQTIGGVITLVGLSGPEKAYRNLMRQLDGTGEPVPTEDRRMSKMRVLPTLLGNEGKLAPGFGLGLSF